MRLLVHIRVHFFWVCNKKDAKAWVTSAWVHAVEHFPRMVVQFTPHSERMSVLVAPRPCQNEVLLVFFLNFSISIEIRAEWYLVVVVTGIP